MLWHELKQIEQADNIVTIIQKRLFHTLTNSLACGKMYYTFDVGVFGKDLVHCVHVTAVHLFESRAHAGNFLNPVNYTRLRI